MAFKDKFNQLLEENGGKNRENEDRIVRTARKVQADFTKAYLSKLLMGYPARYEDYQALGAAFGVSASEFIDDPEFFKSENRHKARKFAVVRMNRPDLVERLIDCIEPGRFRKEVISDQELYLLFKYVLESVDNEDEESLT